MFALLLLACLHARLEPTQCTVAQAYTAVTDDGALLALHRHAAAGPPVLVVHGLSSNHDCWDLGPGRSVAEALQAAGYDAWLLDLRGHGDSRALRPHPRPGWTMDDYGRHDLPAAIALVQRETGYSKIGYLGHSMGGMVAAIYQATFGDDALAAMVIVGSPVDFGDPDPLLSWSQRGMALGTLAPSMPTARVSKSAVPLGDKQPFHADDILFNAENLSPEARTAMFREAVSPVYRNELRQLSRMLRERRFVSADGTIDYRAALARLRIPLLVLAGRVDRVAPPDRVRPYYEAAGSEEKRYVLAGKASGFQADYGHLDLTLGDRAAAEIYPLITGWFEGRWEDATPEG